jgi:broad specificity phosphatase PhoE
LAVVHLVRHGEVSNPADLVYGRLPGFSLSEAGEQQAARQAARLASRPVAVVVASPLERAQETAAAIAAPHDIPYSVDDRLVEWGLEAWSGLTWGEVASDRTVELAIYHERPDELRLGEGLAELAARVAEAIRDAARAAAAAGAGAEAVCVSHSDPLAAGAALLLDRPLREIASVRLPLGGALSLDIDGGLARQLARDP